MVASTVSYLSNFIMKSNIMGTDREEDPFHPRAIGSVHATISDAASLASVSIKVVSRTVNGQEMICHETHQRVLAASLNRLAELD